LRDTSRESPSRPFAFHLATGDVRHALADVAETAARQAFVRAGRGPGDIDLMVAVTATPGMLMLETVSMVADRLGIDDVPTFEL
jgi:3-oxoacyl-[acyl-carrier-protein] synthase III